MSSRDIAGINPLYLPLAMTYDRCCALGRAVLVTSEPVANSSEIKLEILRAENIAFSGATTLAARKRTADDLISYLFRQCSFPHGCVLMMGTGIVPEDTFTLQHGDEMRTSSDGIGTLVNTAG